MRPFSRTCAIVSAPLPITSRYATVRSSSTRRVPPGPFGETFTWPSPASGADPTKNIGWRAIQSRQCWSISSYSRPTPFRLASAHRRSRELLDEAREPLGLVLGHEGPAVGDLLDARVREELGQPPRVLDREEAVLGRPGDQHGAIEAGQALGRLERVAAADRPEQFGRVAPHPLVGLARADPAGGHLVRDAPLREPAVREREPAQGGGAQRLDHAVHGAGHAGEVLQRAEER